MKKYLILLLLLTLSGLSRSNQGDLVCELKDEKVQLTTKTNNKNVEIKMLNLTNCDNKLFRYFIPSRDADLLIEVSVNINDENTISQNPLNIQNELFYFSGSKEKIASIGLIREGAIYKGNGLFVDYVHQLGSIHEEQYKAQENTLTLIRPSKEFVFEGVVCLGSTKEKSECLNKMEATKERPICILNYELYSIKTSLKNCGNFKNHRPG